MERPEPMDEIPKMPEHPADSDWVADSDLFRQAFRRYATTVVIVTYFDSTGRPCGMTATSMCSLSPSPPSLLVCINRSSRAHAEIVERGRYGVNLLSVGQRSVALHCSRPGTDKALPEDWLAGAAPRGSTPRLDGSIAHLECDVASSFDVYSHTVFLGLIHGAWVNPVDAQPLLYHGGSYSQLESATERAERLQWELPG